MPDRPSPQRARTACTGVYVVFAMAGVPVATFGSRIADAKHTLGLSPGQLGAVLLAASLGSVLALPFAGSVAARVGAVRAVLFGLTLTSLGLLTVGVAVDLAHARLLMAAGLFLWGLGIGVWDVAMNLEGATVEKLLGRSVMPRFHACFSGGTVVAALCGAPLSALGVPLTIHFAGAMALSVIGGIWGVRRFLPAEREHERDDAPTPVSARSAWLEPRTLLIGVMVLAAAFTEGSANDWISVAYVDGHGVPAWAGVLAFATFLASMTTGRVLGTGLLDTYGRVVVLRIAFSLACVGSLLVVFGSLGIGYVGAMLWGVGASLGFPVGMSAAADDPTRAPARLSVVATIGYTAFIAGPPLLGTLADHVTVMRALLAVTVVTVLALGVVPAAREPERVPLTAE